MYDVPSLRSLSNSVEGACKDGLFKGVKCCILPAKETRAIIVTITVHPGYEVMTRNVDLNVDQYLLPRPNENRRLYNNDKLAVCLRSFPPTVRNDPWYWTIYSPNALCPSGSVEPVNQVYASFGGGSVKNCIQGNIIVAKSTNRGLLCDVEERDLGHIEWLAYHFFESHADLESLRQSENPMIKPVEGAFL